MKRTIDGIYGKKQITLLILRNKCRDKHLKVLDVIRSSITKIIKSFKSRTIEIIITIK